MTDPRIKQICDLYNHRSTTNPDSNWLQEFAREVLAIAAAAQPSAQVFKVPHEDEGVWRYHVVGATPEAVGLPSAQPLTEDRIFVLALEAGFEPYESYHLGGESDADMSAYVGEYPCGEAVLALVRAVERHYGITPSTQGEPSS